MTSLFIIKCGSDRINTRSSSVLKFLLPYGPMLTKTIRKNLKSEDFEKKIVWNYGR